MDSKIPNIRFKGFTDAWEQRRLGEVTIYQNGKGYEDSQSSSGKFELINLNSISIDGGLKSSGKYIESADKTLLTDDLVMVLSDVGKGDLLGRVAIIPKDNYYVLNQRVALIRPKNKQQTNYLFSYINSHQRYFKLHGAGMSQLNISKGSVENFPLLLPSLPEQQQIGTFFAHLDTLISLHQRKCDQTKELKKTMLQKMFPKKGETVPEIRFPEFTDAWEQRKLGELSNIVGGGTPSTTNSEYWDGDIDWYAPAEIGEQRYVSKSKKTITELGLKKSSARILPVGTVLFTSRAGIGNTAILGKEATTNQGFQSIVPNPNKLDSYFIYSRTNELKRYGEVTGAGSTFVEVSGKQMSKMPIMIPELSEQEKIGSFFKQLDDTIALHQRKCDQTKELKKTMLQKMFPKKGERIPEIRFPEFTDEWEEKKLGEMLTERNVQQVPKEDAPLVSFTVENGVTPKTDRYDREFLVRTGDKKYKYTTFDDIVYNPANLKFGAIARNKFGDAVFSPIYVTLVADKEKVLPIFIERIVTNGNFIQESLRYQEGTVYERMSVKVPDFLSMKISIPSLPEQEAIGTYFQTLDQDIAQIEKKLADLKELKKALLRQLFV